ncbi:MAG: hypothetical protein ABR562_09625, partial [Thermoplasmatota archaeon]
TGLADWTAVNDLRTAHYPLLPIFAAELITAFLDQYFKLIVAMGPVELQPDKRGLSVKFTMHSKTEPSVAAVPHKPEIETEMFE